MIQTIEELYATINPLPAMLLAKGRVQPRATVEFEANVPSAKIWLYWRVTHNPAYAGQEHMELCSGGTLDEAVTKAVARIAELPSSKDENTYAFMRDLGKLIDDGRKIGIEIEYLNPLVESMKRLSENIITYQPAADDIPF